jgi:transcriptional regulator with XRE-family HTH domain
MKKSVWQEKYKTLATELGEIRKSLGLTQSQLAKKLDKPQSYVSKYENGDRYLDFIEVLAVCEACNADPIQLIQKLNISFPK